MIIDIATRKRGAQSDPPEVRAPRDAILAITDTKLYVPVVTLSTQDDNKLLQQLKQDLSKLLIGINTDQKCRNYLIDPTFINVIRLSMLSIKNDLNWDIL